MRKRVCRKIFDKKCPTLIAQCTKRKHDELGKPTDTTTIPK